ncbi:HAD-superfamily hydrolase, subfamily IIB [Polymorphum gilvum SL003B-26A1]|uniref:Trehalose 6-phosphate phosphatase n=1 Tax=Polymorphum gilvum (strain LMG 25793 / CGMCC 1.9160 / SL003B-26A1) TaxID=991905 RepID=F2IVS6_POLGS|nr:HAD-superfamily hydrolase, subfamily IIB [Polymorphum gilvum SL003B-26A1]
MTADAALFLDFDGTLVDLAPRPDAVQVDGALVDALDRLRRRLGGAVAIISGRPIAEIDVHLAPLHLAAAGLHGLEHRDAPDTPVRREEAGAEIRALRGLLNASGLLRDGVFLEDKGPALAVHYRAAPERAGEVEALLVEATAVMPGLHLVRGKMVVEAKPFDRDKGSALRAFMAHAPFEGRVPVYVGDDVTDEDGMRAALAAGGLAIKVGAGESCASYRLADVAAVHAWLETLAPALECQP